MWSRYIFWLVVVYSNITNDLHKHNMANYSFEMMFYKYTQYVLFNEGNSDTEMVDVKKKIPFLVRQPTQYYLRFDWVDIKYIYLIMKSRSYTNNTLK